MISASMDQIREELDGFFRVFYEPVQHTDCKTVECYDITENIICQFHLERIYEKQKRSQVYRNIIRDMGL